MISIFMKHLKNFKIFFIFVVYLSFLQGVFSEETNFTETNSLDVKYDIWEVLDSSNTNFLTNLVSSNNPNSNFFEYTYSREQKYNQFLIYSSSTEDYVFSSQDVNLDANNSYTFSLSKYSSSNEATNYNCNIDIDSFSVDNKKVTIDSNLNAPKIKSLSTYLDLDKTNVNDLTDLNNFLDNYYYPKTQLYIELLDENSNVIQTFYPDNTLTESTYTNFILLEEGENEISISDLLSKAEIESSYGIGVYSYRVYSKIIDLKCDNDLDGDVDEVLQKTLSSGSFTTPSLTPLFESDNINGLNLSSSDLSFEYEVKYNYSTYIDSINLTLKTPYRTIEYDTLTYDSSNDVYKVDLNLLELSQSVNLTTTIEYSTDSSSGNLTSSISQFFIEDTTSPTLLDNGADGDQIGYGEDYNITIDYFDNSNIYYIVEIVIYNSTDNESVFSDGYNPSLTSENARAMNDKNETSFFYGIGHLKLIAGNYEYEIFAKDEFDNLLTTTGSFEIVESEPPKINSENLNLLVLNQSLSPFLIQAEVVDNYLMKNVSYEINLQGSTEKIILDFELNQSTNLYEYVFDYLNLSFGTYEYIILAYDEYENLNNSVSGTFEILDDVSPELLEHNINSTLNTSETPFTIKINTTDNLQISSAKIEVDYPSLTSIQGDMNLLGEFYEYDVDLTEIGMYNFTFTITDTSSNSLVYEMSSTVVDDTAPIFNLYSVDDNETEISIEPYNFTFDITDNIKMGEVFIELFYPNGTIINASLENSSAPIYTYSFIVDKDTLGTYNYSVYAFDNYSNQNILNSNFTILKETISPTMDTELDRVDFYSSEKNLTFEVNISDNYLYNNSYIEVIAPSGDIDTIILNSTQTPNNYSQNYTYDEVGIYNYVIYAFDYYGNMGSSSGTFTVIDDINPDVSSSQNSNNDVVVEVLEEYSILINVSDNHQIDSVEIEIIEEGGPSNFYQMGNLVNSIYNYTYTSQTVGNTVYTIYAYDDSSNLNDSLSRSLEVLDTTLPEISITSPSVNSFINTQTIEVAADIEDNYDNSDEINTNLNIYLDGSFQETKDLVYQSNNNHSLDLDLNSFIGEVTLEFVAVDSSSNEYKTNKTIQISDGTIPIVNIVGLENDVPKNSNIDFTVSAETTDSISKVYLNISDLGEIEMSYDSGNLYVATIQVENELKEYQINSYASNSQNSFGYSAISYFNTTEPIIEDYLVDKTLVELNEEVNIFINATYSDSFYVNISKPDGSNILDYSLTNNDFTSFTGTDVEGIYNLTLYVSDSANNIDIAQTNLSFEVVGTIETYNFNVLDYSNGLYNIEILDNETGSLINEVLVDSTTPINSYDKVVDFYINDGDDSSFIYENVDLDDKKDSTITYAKIDGSNNLYEIQKTYYIQNDFNKTGNIFLDYRNLNINNENNLEVYYCSAYILNLTDIQNSRCSTSFTEISASIDSTNDFIYTNSNENGAYYVLEKESSSSSSSSSSSGGGGGSSSSSSSNDEFKLIQSSLEKVTITLKEDDKINYYDDNGRLYVLYLKEIKNDVATIRNKNTNNEFRLGLFENSNEDLNGDGEIDANIQFSGLIENEYVKLDIWDYESYLQKKSEDAIRQSKEIERQEIREEISSDVREEYLFRDIEKVDEATKNLSSTWTKIIFSGILLVVSMVFLIV